MKLRIGSVVVGFLSLIIPMAAQTSGSSPASAPVPPLIRYSGVAKNATGKLTTGMVGITFSLYQDQQGGTPLWMETQNAQLDSSGHYTVLLGSTKSTGMPTELFASGAAQWLGVQVQGEAEQARVLMVSVPYALKAVDAETLGGKPASAYALATPQTRASAPANEHMKANAAISPFNNNQNPPAAAISGSGTKNYIPRWTSSNALGNSNIFQNATNKNIGIGTTTPTTMLDVKGTTLLDGSSATAFGLTVSSPAQFGAEIQGPITGVGAGLDFETTGRGGKQWEILATGNTASQGVGKLNIRDVNTSTNVLTIDTSDNVNVNTNLNVGGATTTFTGNETVNGNIVAGLSSNSSIGVLGESNATSGQTYGVGGLSASPAGYGVEGLNTASEGTGVYGTAGRFGLYGVATGTGSTVGVFGSGADGIQGSGTLHGVYAASTTGGIGVLGTSSNIGIYGNSVAASKEGAGTAFAGVWGDTGGATGSLGVIGTADNAIGGYFLNNAPDAQPTLLVENNENSEKGGWVFDALGGLGGSCLIDVSGDLTCNGKITASASVENGARKVALYTMQSPENWFEDFGSGALSKGAANIALDPTFIQTVNTGTEYHVFLTANGDCKGLYVAHKSSSSFKVRELGGGQSNVAFDYRIVAKRAGYEKLRFEDLTEQFNKQEVQRTKKRLPLQPPAAPQTGPMKQAPLLGDSVKVSVGR